MADASHAKSLEEEIAQWRRELGDRPARDEVDVAKLEAELRAEIAGLIRLGLASDEAFLVAAKRVGSRGGRAQEFARKHSERAWKQLHLVSPAVGEHGGPARREALIAFGLAVLAATAMKVPVLFGLHPKHDGGFYLRNAGVFVLPCLAGYFVWKRRLTPRLIGWLAAAFGLAAIVANLPGFGAASAFESLTALHLPIALLLAVGVAYAGDGWGRTSGRMDFIRFSGELFIYYVLIALGGGVLTAFMALTFKSIGVDIEPFFQSWVLPCGPAGAIVIAAWLVEARQGVMENMAPVLTRLFTPLFAVMLIAFLGALILSGRGIAIERHVLIGFDLLLVVVLGLLLYSLSARDPQAPPGAFDVLQVVLVGSALLADAVALSAIGVRIGEFGFSPNRVAALGENVILLVNLGWSAVLYLRFVIGRGSFESLLRWQTGYLPVYSAWAAFVVLVFPPLFRWIG